MTDWHAGCFDDLRDGLRASITWIIAPRRAGNAVNCRVDVCPAPDLAVVRVHGRLAGSVVPELERVCRETEGLLILDLTHLMSADDAGIATLQRLMADGARCMGMSRYLALLLGVE